MNTAGPRRFIVFAALVALLALPGAGRAEGSASALAAATPSTGALRICSGCPAAGGDLARYGYVILNSWDAPLLPALKAANPGLKVLVYKNLSFAVASGCTAGVDNPFQSTGVGYCDTNANHPEWFLRDSTGQRIASANFPDAWLMDVGNPAYQARWLANVSADLRAGGWDGVFMDDTNTTMGWHLNGRMIASYPTDAAWQAATRSMLANVGPALAASGFLSVPNLYAPWLADYDAQATWRDWIHFTSGAAQEYYTKRGTTSSGWFAGGDWTFRQQFQAITEQAGKIFIGITYAPKGDTASMKYARANFLLFDEPAAGGALIFEASDPEAQDPYASQWTSGVGSPVGARFQVGAAWRRNYAGGTVIVNPSASPVTVQLEQPYILDNGTSTSSVTLGATSGAVLRSTVSGVPLTPATGQIVLTVTASKNSARLAWVGMTSASADIFRNSSKIATVASTGSYIDMLSRKTRGTYAYRVCVAGTSTCSDSVTVKVGPIATLSTKTRSAVARQLPAARVSARAALWRAQQA